MSYKKYLLFRLVGISIIAGLADWATITDNLLLMIPVLIIVGGLLLVLKRRVSEIVVDERINTVAYKATRLAFLAFILLEVVAAAVLISVGHDGQHDLFLVGLTLAYSACALLLFYWLGFFYYNRKYGG